MKFASFFDDHLVGHMMNNKYDIKLLSYEFICLRMLRKYHNNFANASLFFRYCNGVSDLLIFLL